MSVHRKNSVRDKVIEVEVDLFREIHIPQTECGPAQKTRWPQGMGLSRKVRAAKGEPHSTDRVWTISEG